MLNDSDADEWMACWLQEQKDREELRRQQEEFRLEQEEIERQRLEQERIEHEELERKRVCAAVETLCNHTQ